MVRRVIRIGTSQAVTIPPSWLREIEERTGKKVDEVLMEVNGQIKVYPREDGVVNEQSGQR
jgi:antitoxin component of MazEF toxin-antitoxin module